MRFTYNVSDYRFSNNMSFFALIMQISWINLEYVVMVNILNKSFRYT